jgi:hypothetical protein
MASSKSLKMRAARPRGEGISAAETMVDLEQQIDASAAALEPADTEARLSWRKNLQNRPLGLAGLLDARGQVDVQNIVPVLHDEAARKEYGEKAPGWRAQLIAKQSPTYEQVVASSSPEVSEFIARGISPERVQGAQKPIVTMPKYLPLTGVDFEQPVGPENTIQESYDAYTSSVNTPAHEGFHRLIRNRKGLLNEEDQEKVFSQIPFTNKGFDWMNVEHMFLGGVRYVLAPETLKNDSRFKRRVDKDIAGEYNQIVRAARNASKNSKTKMFVKDPDVRSYFHFKKDSDLVDRPKDKYYELVKDRYDKMVDILQPPAPSEPEEEKSWWQRLTGKNKGGYVMTGAETMMGLD